MDSYGTPGAQPTFLVRHGTWHISELFPRDYHAEFNLGIRCIVIGLLHLSGF